MVIKSEEKYAPVVLFAYARPKHTLKTLSALQKNILASDTTLFIYLDYPKKPEDQKDYEEVDRIVSGLTDFKAVNVIRRSENLGLAKNIVLGVSDIIKQYGRVIVLEDDLVTSEYFLTFMNDSLNKYNSNKNIWHISGWTYPVKFDVDGDVFAWRAMNCWGWATWEDRWQHFNKDPKKLINDFTHSDIHRFNIDKAHNFWKQVKANESGRLNTWAIFWYATIFSNKGLCINPTNTYVQNIGNDGSGENCGTWDVFTSPLAIKESKSLPDLESENVYALNSIKKFYKKNYPHLVVRVYKKLIKIILS